MESERSVEVKVDVTKIVKYVCIAGAVIVSVIFGCKCAKVYLESDPLGKRKCCDK